MKKASSYYSSAVKQAYDDGFRDSRDLITTIIDIKKTGSELMRCYFNNKGMAWAECSSMEAFDDEGFKEAIKHLYERYVAKEGD